MSSANSKAYETRLSKVTNDSAAAAYLEWLIFRALWKNGLLKALFMKVSKKVQLQTLSYFQKYWAWTLSLKFSYLKWDLPILNYFILNPSQSIPKISPVQLPPLNADSHYHNSHLDNTLLHVTAHWDIQHCFESKFLLLTLMTRKGWIEISLCYLLTIK